MTLDVLDVFFLLSGVCAQMPVAAYVLQRFSRKERKDHVEQAVRDAVDLLVKAIEKGTELAVSQQ